MNTATQTRTSECDRCDQLSEEYDQLMAQFIAAENKLIEIHATALAAVTVEERTHAIADAVTTIA